MGVDNYVRSIQRMDLDFMRSQQVTVAFVILTLLLSVVIGLGAALVGTSRFPGRQPSAGLC